MSSDLEGKQEEESGGGWGGLAGCTGMESEGINLLSLVDGGSE